MVPIDNVKIINVLTDDKNFCKNWRSFCRALELGNDIMHDLDRMDTHFSAVQDIIINIFEHWKAVSPQNFNGKTLSEKLREIGCAESAGTIESLCGNGEDMQHNCALIWFNVRPTTAFYAGRETEMEIIEKQWVACAEKKMLLFVAITGLGGIGKSELAANYAKHFHESKQGHCIWINAESSQTLLQSFQNLATSELKIPMTDLSGREKEITLLVREIHAKLTDKKCLYIFDNLDCYEQPTIQCLKELASQQSPSVLRPFVLMTSRLQPANKYFGNNCKPLELDILKDEAAIKFFCDYFEIEENKSRYSTINVVIQRLCHRLKFFPLALQQAAAYIVENLSHGSERDTSEVEGEVEEYLHKIEIETKKLLNHKIPDESHTTYFTWGITMEKICKIADGGMEATKIMNIISFLTPDNISVEFLLKVIERVEDESSSFLNRGALQMLQDHSMVKVQQKKNLSVHRLVQEVTRIKLKEWGGWLDLLDQLLQILQEMMKANEIKSDQLIHVQRIWKHATENAELIEKHGEFPTWIIQKLLDSGKYREMFDFSCQALSTLESTLGENHRWTLQIKRWKGVALDSLGEYLTALELLTDVYEKQKELFGEEDGDFLATANVIGAVHWRLKKYDEALKLFRNALEKRERISGKEHTETLSLKNNMALVLDKQGKYKEAMELYQQVLEVKDRVMGNDHPETLKTKHDMACVRCNQGNYEDALEMFQEILQAREWVLGVNNPDTLSTKDWIAGTYKCLRRNDEAIELYNEVLEKREQILGPDHPDTLRTNHNLAAVGFKQRQFLDEPLIFEGVKERVFGVNHPYPLATTGWIADLYGRKVPEKKEDLLRPVHPRILKKKPNFSAVRIARKQEQERVFVQSHLNRGHYHFLDEVGRGSPMHEKHLEGLFTLEETYPGGGVESPNLKYLNLDDVTHKTHIHLDCIDEVNVGLLPQNISHLQISNKYYYSNIHIAGGVRNVDNLIVEYLDFEQVEECLRHFPTSNLVIYNHAIEPKLLMPLMNKRINTIAVGRIHWEKEDFKNYTNELDKQADYYFLEGGKGRSMEENEFEELNKFKE